MRGNKLNSESLAHHDNYHDNTIDTVSAESYDSIYGKTYVVQDSA